MPETLTVASSVELAVIERSGFVESRHAGAAVVLDPAGAVALTLGDVETPILPRSSLKPLQALGSVTAGAELAGERLALATASHSGTDRHVAVVRGILDQAGLDESHLGCPAAWPTDTATRDELVRELGSPQRIRMNCSGKHAAMLTTCLRAGWPTADLLDPAHPLQRRIRATIERITGSLTHDIVGVDGCGAPVFATDLVGLARGFRTLVSAAPGSRERAVADAMRQHPQLVGGSTSGDTLLMTRVPGMLVKLGADGVQAFALPDGRAVAFKIADGGERARLPLIRAALDFLGVPTDVVPGAPGAPFADAVIRGGGRPVGSVVAAPTLFG